MAGSVLATPGWALQPSAEQVALESNYLASADFTWMQQYLPDTYEKEFERYGNRTISSFLRLVGAEMPSNSDLIKWAEQGRLHTKYTQCGALVNPAGQDIQTFQVHDALVPGTGSIAVRVNQTVMVVWNNGVGSNKAIVTGVNTAANTFDVAYY